MEWVSVCGHFSAKPDDCGAHRVGENHVAKLISDRYTCAVATTLPPFSPPPSKQK